MKCIYLIENMKNDLDYTLHTFPRKQRSFVWNFSMYTTFFLMIGYLQLHKSTGVLTGIQAAPTLALCTLLSDPWGLYCRTMTRRHAYAIAESSTPSQRERRGPRPRGHGKIIFHYRRLMQACTWSPATFPSTSSSVFGYTAPRHPWIQSVRQRR